MKKKKAVYIVTPSYKTRGDCRNTSRSLTEEANKRSKEFEVVTLSCRDKWMNKQEDGRQSEQRRRGTAGRLVVLLVGSAWRGGQGEGKVGWIL